jgi:hypothetical protein
MALVPYNWGFYNSVAKDFQKYFIENMDKSWTIKKKIVIDFEIKDRLPLATLLPNP